MTKDIIVILILIIVFGLALGYIIKSKKSGVKCIGCPSGGSCSLKNKKNNDCGCGCCNNEK